MWCSFLRFAILPCQCFVFNVFDSPFGFEILEKYSAFTCWLKQMVTYTDHTYQEYLYM